MKPRNCMECENSHITIQNGYCQCKLTGNCYIPIIMANKISEVCPLYKEESDDDRRIFKKIIKKFNIPEDVTMLSDSGWECSETDMDGIWYNEEEKELIFTQNGDEYEHPYFDKPEWVLLHSREDIEDGNEEV